jgi:PAS domain-containing protein
MSSASEVDATLRSIIDAIPGHVFILGRNGRDYLSNLELDYLGLTREEMLGQDIVPRVFHPEDVEELVRQWVELCPVANGDRRTFLHAAKRRRIL